MLIFKSLSGIAFVGSIAWFASKPDYEPAIAVITSLSAFIATWFSDQKQNHQGNQNQSVSKNGIGIQAGGDVNLGSIHPIGKNSDAK